ncbi:MAG: 16S rRNA (uracil(1498)-N(3))-methyltransferase [Kiritimatiellae bacterium]|nr:16S rRNA (uracil(1498)-N(3))-methyltransferase [Kiritimatiellia bacterium]
MNTFKVSPAALENAVPDALGRDDERHLRDVLRIRPGEKIRLSDGRGRIREAEVAEVSRRSVALGPFGPLVELAPPPSRAVLFACVAKPARMDWLLEKACELGAAKIVPVLSSRVVSKHAPGETPQRWLRIVDSAFCQSGGGWATRLAPCTPWKDALAAAAALGGPVFAGSLAPGAEPLGDALLARREALRSGPVGWFVGPEGDFSPEELAELSAVPGVVPVSLGPRVLRVETAAACGLSTILCLALR